MSTSLSRNKVIELALEEIGYIEGAGNDNKYAKIAGHPNKLPWCATFIYAMFKEADLAKAIPNTSSCQAIEKWAQESEVIVPIKSAKRGDLILMDFSKSGKAQHVGIAISRYKPDRKTIHTVEGNTGDKSQINGEGVYLKTRGVGVIRCVVRPRYPKNKEETV